ncbi:MAG: hypothetical protein N3A38_01980 [Planctomycetota bacterium]|nr:hypothetical protein [Planctomycetota bacterium]
MRMVDMRRRKTATIGVLAAVCAAALIVVCVTVFPGGRSRLPSVADGVRNVRRGGSETGGHGGTVRGRAWNGNGWRADAGRADVRGPEAERSRAKDRNCKGGPVRSGDERMDRTPRPVRLRRRTVLPSPDAEIVLPPGGGVVLMQMAVAATEETARGLEGPEIRLLAPSGHGAHYAWVSRDGLSRLREHPLIRGVAAVLPEDKLSDGLVLGERPAYATDARGRLLLRAWPFPGIGELRFAAALRGGGFEPSSPEGVVSRPGGPLDVAASPDDVSRLASVPEV